jgi:hypothetical protein
VEILPILEGALLASYPWGRGLQPKEFRDIIYLVDHAQIQVLELNDEIELACDVEEARDEKNACKLICRSQL